MPDIDEKNYPIFIDDSPLFAFPHINFEKEYRSSLEQELKILQHIKKDGLGFNSEVALVNKMYEHGLKIKADTDLNWLAYTLRRLNIRTLEEDLEYMLFVQKINRKLDEDSYEARLKLEMEKCGLELTPDTDIKQLAQAIKQLGIPEKIL